MAKKKPVFEFEPQPYPKLVAIGVLGGDGGDERLGVG